MKKITQNDLRKVMLEQKKKLVAVKKIESPLAKYTELGQLMCILCQCKIRNEAAWPVHIVSAKHKEKVEQARKTKLEFFQTNKRLSSEKEVSCKKFKPEMLYDQEKSVNKNSSNEELKGLPADFFDKPSTVQNLENVDTGYINEPMNKMEEKKDKDSSLPEGFFDDPILDAKVRNVEYKNPMDDEWERFQREIKEETAQSAQIIAEDQEEATAERQLEEIDEQIHNWSRVMDLVKMKESVQREEKKYDTSMDDATSNDEMEYDEEMDWRAKKSVK